MKTVDLQDKDRYARIVVKIGSGLLVDWHSGALRRDWLAALVSDLSAFRVRGQDIIIVSSGAVALGGRRLGLENPRQRLNQAQAAAAVGQIGLAHAYEESFAASGLKVAQMLLTIGDLEDRKRYLNARSTLETLLGMGVVPVINENDTVATSEIRFGDNDRLAARVAQLAGADMLILLSDVDGFYTANPDIEPAAKRIEVVTQITEEMESAAGASRNAGFGSGGMASKLAAARIAMRAGCSTLITDGRPVSPISGYPTHGVGTLFVGASSATAARKAWLNDLELAAGTIIIDDGAVSALKTGNSLLAAGISDVRGDFGQGDLVLVECRNGRAIGRGLIAYGKEDCLRIAGRRSEEFDEVLGYPGRGPVIHRDNFVLDDGLQRGRE